jgi:hypothetical protein
MRREISSEGEALKGLPKILSTWLDFVGVKSFPPNPIFVQPEGKG